MHHKVVMGTNFSIILDNHSLTIALYFEAIALASVDLPLIGGPSTQTLQGIFGFGGLR